MFPLSAIGLFEGGDWLMLYATGEQDWDAVIGGPILQAVALLMLAFAGYYLAAIYGAAVVWRERA